MKNQHQILLETFCSKDEMRPWMTKPFVIGNKILATDAHVLIELPYSGTEHKEDPEITAKLKHLYPFEQNMECHFDAQALQKILDTAPKVPKYATKEGECPECDEWNEVEFTYRCAEGIFTMDGECPVCEGSGLAYIEDKSKATLVFEENNIAVIGNSPFGLNILNMLALVAKTLDQKRITILHQTTPNKSSLFKVGDAKILLMPVMQQNGDNILQTIALT